MADPTFYPYNRGQQIEVISSFGLLNLISLDVQSNVAGISFMLKISWTDTRLDMPPLWSALSKTKNYNNSGVNVFHIFGKQFDGNTCGWWVPDIIFPDAVSIVRSNENFFIYPGGRVSYQSQIVAGIILLTIIHFTITFIARY